MTTNEILANINGDGGFNNHRWGIREISEWVQANFQCSRYVAEKVARRIK